MPDVIDYDDNVFTSPVPTIEFLNPLQRRLTVASKSLWHIERQFIDKDLSMKPCPMVQKLREKLKYTPDEQCGFAMNVLLCDKISQFDYIDTGRVISLACSDEIIDPRSSSDVSLIDKYSSK